MKRTMLLTALCLSLALPFTSRSTAEAKEIGDVVGQVLATDIQAYVNGSPIPSMNVFGYTAVAAEDLRQYGFDVAWIPQQRRLVIHNRSGKRLEPIPVQQTKEEPGTKMADVLYTDIETYYGDTKIPSYNIDGKTAVLLNDLEPFGEVVWSEQERKMSFTPAPAADAERPVQSPLVLRQTDSITLDGIAFGDEEITYEDAVVGRIVNGRPMMSVSWMANQFGYSVEKTNDGYYVNNGTYSFLLHPGENQTGRFWFGSPVGDNNLSLAPVLDSEGELLAYETDLKHLFGYYSVWDPGTRKLNVVYRSYLVEDYGLPDSLNNYFYSAKVDSYISGIGAEPMIFVMNRINGKEPIFGGSSGGSVQDADGNEPNFRMLSSVPVDFGHNDIDVTITEDWRILFHKSLSVDLSMKQVESKIDYSRLSYSFGDYTVLKSVTPKQAYIQTTSSSFEATGEVFAKNGNGLTFTVEVQEDDQYRKISEQNVPFDQDTFDAKLTLPDAPGLYRITAVSLVTNPRNTTTTPVAKWYVDKGKDVR
jgi:hypothetical protein